MRAAPRRRPALRFVLLVGIGLLSLQLYFLARIALMGAIDPQSTTFQRSEAWRLAFAPGNHPWQQRWAEYTQIAASLKRAVIASEDSGFTEHSGIEWDALEKAWEKNERADARAEQVALRAAQREVARGAGAASAARPRPPPKVVGGSTITQQLAKNLFLGGERSFLRKGQELLLSFELEALLGKRRILELYLNSVEWGEGVFGAEAAAEHYFGVAAGTLSVAQAAQLAVMLPAPKRFEKRPGSPYLASRGATVAARMGRVDVP